MKLDHLLLGAAAALVFLLGVPGTAQAAPSRQALEAAAEAARLDFERDGVVGSPDEVKGAWREACDLGYDVACRPEAWHDDHGMPDLQTAASVFAKRCSRQDPVACLVEGWALEATPLPPGLQGEERIEAEVDQLVDAQKRYREGCSSGLDAACHELARYSARRVEIGAGRNLSQYDNGARVLFGRLCRGDYMPSCTALGALQPQLPEALDDRGSAGALYTQACDAGHVDGCYRLGSLLASQKSTAENRHWFDGLCDQGHTAACAWVARSWSDDDSAEADAAALDAWKHACLLHSVEGCRKAGPALEAVRPAEAMQVHRMGCALGDGDACGRLGLMLLGQNEIDEAVAHLDEGCEAGVVQACVEVGLLRIEGRHVDADPRRAMQNLQSGCPEDGDRDPEACHAVGRLYEDGFGAARDRAIAARYYGYACEGGNIQSCYRVGEAVTSLQRASQSPELLGWALGGYTQACDKGVEQACLPAARILASGPVSIRDADRARDLFTQRCDAGESLACREFGAWLVSQPDTSSDLETAREAFDRGSELGDTESTRLLAKMYWFGQGGKRKRGKARRLFRQACNAGNPKACGGVEMPDR